MISTLPKFIIKWVRSTTDEKLRALLYEIQEEGMRREFGPYWWE